MLLLLEGFGRFKRVANPREDGSRPSSIAMDALGKCAISYGFTFADQRKLVGRIAQSPTTSANSRVGSASMREVSSIVFNHTSAVDR